MVDRGSCTFVNKVRNVQKLGGALALIVDNSDEDINKVIMNDDGTGSDIYIPAIMISKQDGQKIKDFFLKNKDDNQLLSSIVVAVEFQIVRK
jgi:extracellular elastinolytic metalloproteinase